MTSLAMYGGMGVVIILGLLALFFFIRKSGADNQRVKQSTKALKDVEKANAAKRNPSKRVRKFDRS